MAHSKKEIQSIRKQRLKRISNIGEKISNILNRTNLVIKLQTHEKNLRGIHTII